MFGISLASEKQQRKHAQEIVGDNVQAETVPFTFPFKSGGEEIRAAPMAYIPLLETKVFELLDEKQE